MKTMSLEVMECLDYLREKEDALLWEIDVSKDFPDGQSMVEFAENELRIIRTIKTFVELAEEEK